MSTLGEWLETFRSPSILVGKTLSLSPTATNTVHSMDSGHSYILDLVEAALTHIGCDLAVPLLWNLDNCLLQAECLRSYLPELVPTAIGLARFCREAVSASAELVFRSRFPEGTVLLRSIVDVANVSPAISLDLRSLTRYIEESANTAGELEHDNYYLCGDHKCSLAYRVHVLNRSIIGPLTLRNDGSTIRHDDSERSDVEGVVQGAVARLPDAFCAGLNVWHVSCNSRREYFVDRLSFIGKTQLQGATFRASRDLESPLNAARLLRFIGANFNIAISFGEQEAVRAEKPDVMDDVLRVKCWCDLLAISDQILSLSSGTFYKVNPSQASIRGRIRERKATALDHEYISYIEFLMKATYDLR